MDDHAIVREGYRRLLERTPDLAVTAEAASGAEAHRLFCELAPAVVVMAINLPGISGSEATRRILAHDPAASVLAFSMYDDALVGARALQAGARGYVTKASAPDTLVDAVRALAAGHMYLSHDFAQTLALHGAGQDAALNALSPAEFEVFRLLAEGWSVSEIARILALSDKTVANHQTQIKRKLEVNASGQLVWIALERGLVQRFMRGGRHSPGARP